MKSGPQQNKCNAQDRQNQYRRALCFHLLPIEPQLGAIRGIHMRRLFIQRQLGIKSKKEDKQR